ncbi:adenylate/guanylate cyclase domain-containing protein [Mesorhizobium sp. BHbdii]
MGWPVRGASDRPDCPSNPVAIRIGINLGDVIVEDDGDIYDEGVNVAARLEALAPAGGILISGKVHDEVEGKLNCGFEDRGSTSVKNIARPVRTYLVQREERPRLARYAVPPCSRRSNIAVPRMGQGRHGPADREGGQLAQTISNTIGRARYGAPFWSGLREATR